jgi:probable phosphoglycerate mutase
VRNIYVVAHPEATHHVDNLVGGWHDSRLTLAGAHAAISIAESLRAMIPDDAEVELFSSDLQRTWETANVVGERLGVNPVPDRGLREKVLRRGWRQASGVAGPDFRPAARRRGPNEPR